jgi:cytochrome P450
MAAEGLTTADRAYDLADPGLLFRPDVLEDPLPLYAQLRRDAPVWEMPGSGTFVVSTAELVTEAVNRPDDFSSNLLSLLFQGEDGRPVVFDMSHLGAAIHVMATADDPLHNVHRKLLQPPFSPGAVEARSEWVRAVVDELLEPLLRDGGGDFATQMAEPLPVRVICEIIGIPGPDVATLAPLVLQSNDLLAGVVDGETMASSAAAAAETSAYLTELLRTWKSAPATEGTTCDLLVQATADGRITLDAGVGTLVQLLGAGTETTTGLIGRALLQMGRDPALQSRLRGEPELIPTAIEETLRFDGPFQFHYRAAMHDTTIGGVPIPAGSRVLLMWAAANRDADAVEHPDEFDIERAVPRAHLAFGRGIHFCIGAPLARLEARIVIERLLQRTASVALDDTRPVAIRPSIFLRRFASLPLSVEAA